MKRFRIKSLRLKKFYPLFAIAAIAIAIPVTVLLAQQQQFSQQHAAGNCTTLTLSKPLTLDKTTVAYGETISGSVTYTNNSNCDVHVLDLAVGTRAPGQSIFCPQNNCPFFVPGRLNVTVHPGESVMLNDSFTPDSSDQPGLWRAYPSYDTDYWHNGNIVYYRITRLPGGGGNGSGGSSGIVCQTQFQGTCMNTDANNGQCPNSNYDNNGQIDCGSETCCTLKSAITSCKYYNAPCVKPQYCASANQGQLDCSAGTVCCRGEVIPTPKPGSCDAISACTPGLYGIPTNCPSGQVCRTGFCFPVTCPTPTGPQRICLSENTLIDTPNGSVKVQELQVGMRVYSVNTLGEKVSVPVLQVFHTPVPSTHTVVHFVLSDGRAVFASKGHPTANGLTVDQLKIGDTYDGSVVIKTEAVPYQYQYTYDLLPASDTSFYFANGILLGSTLKKN